jgi:hypothetical protein
MLEGINNRYLFREPFMFRLVRPLVLAVILLTASSLAAQEAMPTTHWYPLTVGTTWTYKTKDGNHFVMKVTKEDKVKAGESEIPCARIGLFVDGKEVGSECIHVKNDGVYRASFGTAIPDMPVQILKLPPKAGETWEIKGKALGDNFSGEFKIGKQEEIEVPEGKYMAYPVTSDNLNASGLRATTTSWYAERRGLIKQEIKINSQTTVIELEKFTEPR